jgi:hypothetical protein
MVKREMIYNLENLSYIYIYIDGTDNDVLTEHPGIRPSNSAGTGFISQPGEHLSLLKFFVIPLDPGARCWGNLSPSCRVLVGKVIIFHHSYKFPICGNSLLYSQELHKSDGLYDISYYTGKKYFSETSLRFPYNQIVT